MPRFFIHIVNDVSESRDDDGADFADLDSVYREARRALGAIIADELDQGCELIHLTMIIDDEGGQVANMETITTTVLTTTHPAH